MISSGFAADLILSINSTVEMDFPAVFSTSSGNWTEMMMEAVGFKNKFWDGLIKQASLKSKQGTIELIFTKLFH